MSDDAGKPSLERRLFSRPRAVIEAEQKRHDRAQRRGMMAAFAALFGGGGASFLIARIPMVRAMGDWPVILICLVLIGGPLAAAFLFLARVPPKPFDAQDDTTAQIDKKQAAWRTMLASQIFMFGLFVGEMAWLPHSQRLPGWITVGPVLAMMLLMIFFVVLALYARPAWMRDFNLSLDDEVTRSFRARAKGLGYFLLLIVLMGFCILARLDPVAAARFMPLGLVVGCAMPVFYFVYLDWRASVSG